MRSKIEANEYKDYILGFIFYKFLSDQEVKFLISRDWTLENMREYLREDVPEAYNDCMTNLGYFISYSVLFSTWITPGSGFGVADVRDALNRFSRNINPDKQKVFKGIFELSKTDLANSAKAPGRRPKQSITCCNL